MEQVALSAFAMGLISASSLPLGTLTMALWRPGERVVAVLIAFGAGALLAALTLDLVGVALAHDQFESMAIGAVAGGLLFVVLNQLVNNRGGFLRKSSTAILHIRRERRLRNRRLLKHVGRINIFTGLSEEEFAELGDALFRQEYPPGATLYRPHDPCDWLYIVAHGEVELFDPARGMESMVRSVQNDAFGHMAFFTGSPHTTLARTRTEVSLWVLAREDLNRLLVTSPNLQAALTEMIAGAPVMTYLRERQDLTTEQAEAWVADALESLHTLGTVPPAVTLEQDDEQVRALMRNVGGALLFDDLPEEELRRVAGFFFHLRIDRGEALFQRDQLANRMYVVDEGEIAMMDPLNDLKPAEKLRDGDAVGSIAFVTGARHARSAIATMETTLWVLRESDFVKLLRQSPLLEEQVRGVVQAETVAGYLRERQLFNADAAASWVNSAVRSLETGKPIRSAADFAEKIKEHPSAPIAIWLGIMLDGIPESLVIGSSMIHSNLSLSLLAGLFLSNYPEALSSSMGMSQQGMSFRRILLMWSSLMLMTGIGAALGNLFFTGAGPASLSLIQGLAAGAMLTMIAETMLPEAYIKGGSMIGLATLAGFLAAIFFKTLEH